jgi:hypothetical protein
MDVQRELNWIQSELMKVKDPDLIAAIKSLLKYRESKESKDWASLLSEEEKMEIKEGVEQLDRGEKVSYESVMKNYR